MPKISPRLMPGWAVPRETIRAIQDVDFARAVLRSGSGIIGLDSTKSLNPPYEFCKY